MPTDFSKTPSLQHLVKLIGESPEHTAKNILRLKNRNGGVRTFEARNYIRSYLSGMNYDQVLRQASEDRREFVSKAAQEVLPLIKEYTSLHPIPWFKPLQEILYEVCPGIVIPICPLGLSYVDGKMRLIWPQLWKYDTLEPHQFNLWATFIHLAVIKRFPDIESFHWLELSIPDGKDARELRVRSESAARHLSDEEMSDFRDHLQSAILTVDQVPKPDRPAKRKKDPRQDDLFE